MKNTRLIQQGLVLVAMLVTGCTSMVPVNAWEKEDLSRPEMMFGQDVLEMKTADKIYFSREAATGGSGVGGGGCGCN